VHFEGSSQWPDKQQISECRLHVISLVIELRKNGYKEWEWFCKDFAKNAQADTGSNPSALKDLENIRPQLQRTFFIASMTKFPGKAAEQWVGGGDNRPYSMLHASYAY